ncbi:MAG: hypothetical protein JWP37_1390 [Mucilaginibacter sp.]|nr:hypothetical protein [Mucilaginibacter sp.]
MPFTFSHPAIVLPFNYLPKKWFSLTALVTGSMIPDFEYFIRMNMETRYSHTWTGLFWFDLPLTLFFMLIYNALVKDKLIDHLPVYLNKRLSRFKTHGRPYFKQPLAIIMLSAVIGGASHIFWDSFTHPGRYFVTHIPALTHIVFIAGRAFPVFEIVQHLSTLTGAIIIAYAIVQLPVGEHTGGGKIVYYWISIVAVALLFVMIRLFTGLNLQQYGDVIVTGISGMLIGLVLISIITPSKRVALS